MEKNNYYKAARVVSAIFNPFIVPFVAFLVLFFFSYLNMLPLVYRLIVLGVVYAFTILLPTLSIFFFRKINGWGISVFMDRRKRVVPYLLTITCYVACYIMMVQMNLPRYMSGIILASLLAMIVSTIFTFKWKVSEHMIAMGGVVGGLIAFSFLFNYNPLFFLSLFILVAGGLGSARIMLRHHTLADVLMGFAIGFICSLLGILYL